MGLPGKIPHTNGREVVSKGGRRAGDGLLGSHDVYVRSLGINVNLIWGIVLLVCGTFFIVLGSRPGRA